MERIRNVWRSAPIAWLTGVRRVGKTTLASSFDSSEAKYYNCEIPEVSEMTRDPLLFFRGIDHPIVILDEVHYLPDPSRLLKIGADEFPKLKILATGSSTLAASRKFSDTLTGRKRTVHLTPVLATELPHFGGISLERRLCHGGLPPALLASKKEPGFYREWMDSFFARDLQRLFALRDVNKFTALFEYLMRQSGGLFEMSKTARSIGISRPTVENHILALETTHAITMVRPFFGGGQKEIVKMPKCYGFDTGFISFCRGWDPIRPDDAGILWEHVVLEFLQAHLPDERVQFWRDSAGHEIDFVRVRNREETDAIECKRSADQFDAAALTAFRRFYPKGRNFLICPAQERWYNRRYKDIEVIVCNLEGLEEAAISNAPSVHSETGRRET